MLMDEIYENEPNMTLDFGGLNLEMPDIAMDGEIMFGYM
jgi:hypothetical protein